ncbi:dUTP diphosphatase [Pontibacillus litoralis]|uniref:dUTPase n=1 Tax=Pontibacillus litoralis JSM 072002 TaxID=1385512 RepID=A0A0A5GD01_9BACI|nr:dUTP diphosphatase [Pontibacillus litoralis]KGX89068.1 hypothetical protein N784_01710 [Pontibacillus litoralis JSM 072002]
MKHWNELFTMQKKLDDRIELEHGLEKQDLFSNKVLALFVELGELANETRCFKFWSTKAAKPRAVILEEYVDGLHFILSLGLEKDFRFAGLEQSGDCTKDATEHFHAVFHAVHTFHQAPSQTNYDLLFASFLHLGMALGFTEQAIVQAYYEKNKVNHERQDQGY